MKTLTLITTLSFITLSIIVLVFIGSGLSEANKKIESDRMETAKTMCESGSKWVKLKGELNTRSCNTFKR